MTESNQQNIEISKRLEQEILPHFLRYTKNISMKGKATEQDQDYAYEEISNILNEKYPDLNITENDVRNFIAGKYIAFEKRRPICEQIVIGELAPNDQRIIGKILKLAEQLRHPNLKFNLSDEDKQRYRSFNPSEKKDFNPSEKKDKKSFVELLEESCKAGENFAGFVKRLKTAWGISEKKIAEAIADRRTEEKRSSFHIGSIYALKNVIKSERITMQELAKDFGFGDKEYENNPYEQMLWKLQKTMDCNVIDADDPGKKTLLEILIEKTKADRSQENLKELVTTLLKSAGANGEYLWKKFSQSKC